MTATVPGEQDTQLNLHATTAKEFRELLGRIRDTSGLSGGQVAAKTGMPRSTAYSLTSPNRPGLPSNPEQVRAFAQACGLSATQVDVVMDLWDKLHNQQEEGSPYPDPRTLFDHVSLASTNLVLEDTAFMARISDHVAYLENQQTRKTTLLDLAHYVLADSRRYARALRLVQLLVILAAVFVGGLVMIAVLVPSTALIIVTGLLAAPLMMGIWGSTRHVGAALRKKRPR